MPWLQPRLVARAEEPLASQVPNTSSLCVGRTSSLSSGSASFLRLLELVSVSFSYIQFQDVSSRFGTNSKSGELFFFTYDHQQRVRVQPDKFLRFLIKTTSDLEEHCQTPACMPCAGKDPPRYASALLGKAGGAHKTEEVKPMQLLLTSYVGLKWNREHCWADTWASTGLLGQRKR